MLHLSSLGVYRLSFYIAICAAYTELTKFHNKLHLSSYTGFHSEFFLGGGAVVHGPEHCNRNGETS